MSREEIRTLASHEGAAQYISRQTGLGYDRVLRIYKLGQPWPLLEGEEWNIGRQATEAGVDVTSAMAALAPLIEMTVEEKRAKLEALKEMIARGNLPTEEQIAEFGAGLDNPVLDEHLEKVSTLTNEPAEVIHQVFRGILAMLNRMSELTQELIDKRLEENR